MKFQDKRSDTNVPVSPGLSRLVGALVAHGYDRMVSGAMPSMHYENSYITLSDHDPKTGLSVPHLQLNFEPAWMDAGFADEWKQTFGTTLRSEMLENKDWKRFAWGVWEE